MSPLFWLDTAAYGISTILATALALMVLGTGSRRAPNRNFAHFALAQALWAVSSLLMRIAMWLDVGNPAFLLELSTLAFGTMGPFLLSFTIRYVGRRPRWADLLGVLGLVLIATLSIPLFNHQILSPPEWRPPHPLPLYTISPLGLVITVIPILYFFWSLLLFWIGRHRSGSKSMAASVLLILAGFVIGGLFQPYFPIMSITTTISVVILGYGIVGQQLLNPLQELTVTLERRVKKRTQELTETAARLGVVNATLAQRSIQLETAARVAQEAAAIRDVGELLNETVNLISDRFGFYHAGIFLLDEAKEFAVLQAASSEGGKRMLARGRKIKVSQTGFVGSVAATGKPRIVHNVRSLAETSPELRPVELRSPRGLSSYRASDTATFNTPDLPSTRSEIAVPLKAHGQVIGVLDVQSINPREFSDDDTSALQILADQVALAIENARLLEEAQRQLHEVDVLLGRHGREGWQKLAAERPGWGYVYDGINIARRSPGHILRTTAKMEAESQLTVPLQVRDASIGHLNLELPEQTLTPEAMDLAQAIADQAGQALENARLFQEAQRTLQETEALYRAGQAIGASISAGDVGRALIDYVSDSGVDAARVLLFEHDERGKPTYMIMQEGWAVDERPAQPYGTRLLLNDYPLVDLLHSNEPILVQDVLFDERANEATRTFVTAVSGLRSIILVPISVGERWIGILSAGRNEPSTFTDEFVRGYETLASQAAIALESIRLLEETQQRAERERLIGEITTRMRETLDIDTVLQTAIREMSQVLNLSQVEVRIASRLTSKD